MADGLYQVTTSYMCAGLVVAQGRVVDAAPILGWTRGKAPEVVYAWISKKQGSMVRVNG